MFTSTLNSFGAVLDHRRFRDDLVRNSINRLIGGRVRLRRTSLGISPQQLSKFLENRIVTNWMPTKRAQSASKLISFSGPLKY